MLFVTVQQEHLYMTGIVKCEKRGEKNCWRRFRTPNPAETKLGRDEVRREQAEIPSTKQ